MFYNYYSDLPGPQYSKGMESYETTDINIKKAEERYTYENELISAVTGGNIHKLQRLYNAVAADKPEMHSSDPVRNIKNHCIIINTLLRKAAESGGVHPINIDKMSSDFNKKIESCSNTAKLQTLMYEMPHAYCNLVRNYKIKEYSPVIQRIITVIDFDLAADLSLSKLAEKQNINASYLSSLFKKEIGKSLTEYVNEKRINAAKKLLENTNLQIQTIAQHCGILDAHYFSRLFKKYTGKTPREYRDSVNIL